MAIRLRVLDQCPVRLSVQREKKTELIVNGEFYGSAPPYEGQYVVIPKAYDDQVLPTQGKRMEDNLTVTKVPYYETTNDYGTTVTIAS